jgi:hypothetical protein
MHYLTDVSRLDGLNKNMREWDVAHYGRIFNTACKLADMTTISYPEGKKIALFIEMHEPRQLIIPYQISTSCRSHGSTHPKASWMYWIRTRSFTTD